MWYVGTPLYAPVMSKPVFERISRNLASILESAWDAPQIWDDPVQWRRREKNVIADFLVNYTMNRGQSWSK